MQPILGIASAIPKIVAWWLPVWLVILVSAKASVVVTTSASADENNFDSLISAVDLLNVDQPMFLHSTTTVAPTSGFQLNGAHDGATASYLADPNLSYTRNTYFDGTQTTLTFFLNTNVSTGGSATGYSIGGVNVFAGWKDADVFQGQKWALRVSTVDNPNFTKIESVSYSPPAGSKSSLISITNTGSALASGVTAVQFYFQKLSSAGIVVREIDIVGIPEPPSPPAPPSELTAWGSTGLTNGQVTLSWTAAPGATGYRILRSGSNDARFSVIGDSPFPAFTDTTAGNGITYRYEVVSTNSAGDGPGSFPVRATPSAQAAAPLRILCIGDGNTTGYTDNPHWRIPFEFGYRSGVYLRMVTNGHPIRFVGTSPEPWTGNFGLPTNTPSPDLRLLDQDHHRGYAGAKTSFVLANMSRWLAFDKPDIVLIMVGIDDTDMALAQYNLTNILHTIVTESPDVVTILAQVTPMVAYSQFIVDYNRFIRDTLVPSFQAQGGKVFTADLHASLLTNGTIDPSLFSNGFNHPGTAAYDRMAQTFYTTIQGAMTSPARATITGVKMSGNKVILTGSGGTPYASYSISASTNLAFPDSGPGAESPIKTFDESGSFTCTNFIPPGSAPRFFRIKLR